MNEVQNMAYQLKDIQIPNSFNNILEGDKIEIRISTTWTPGAAAVDIRAIKNINAIPDDWLTVDFSSTIRRTGNPFFDDMNPVARPVTTRDSSVLPGFIPNPFILENVDTYQMQKQWTGQRLVTFLNDWIQEYTAYAIYKQTYGVTINGAVTQALTTHEQNLVYFSATSKLIFDADSGKLGLSFQPSPILKGYVLYTTGNETDGDIQLDQNFTLQGVSIEFKTVAGDRSTKQERLARYLGLTRANPHDIATGYDILTTVNENNQYTQWAVVYMETYDVLNNNSGLIDKTFKKIVVYMHKYMNMFRYTHLYLHTSLNTNFWDQYGQKSDVIQTIPVESLFGQWGNTIRNDTRVYQIKNTSFQGISLFFTDENDEDVTFNEEYTLNVAFFFN